MIFVDLACAVFDRVISLTAGAYRWLVCGLGAGRGWVVGGTYLVG